jgi:hypothetical protein
MFSSAHCFFGFTLLNTRTLLGQATWEQLMSLLLSMIVDAMMHAAECDCGCDDAGDLGTVDESAAECDCGCYEGAAERSPGSGTAVGASAERRHHG